MEVNSSEASRCSECDSDDLIIKKARKSYCRNCWKYRCEFQFRKRLFEFGRPAKGTVGEVFKPAEEVLICYDGSPSSVALTNLALNALTFGNGPQTEGSKSDLNGSPGVVGRQKQHLQSLLRWTKYAEKVSNGIPCPLLASGLEMSLQEYHTLEAVDLSPSVTPIVVQLSDPDQQQACESNHNKCDMCSIDGLGLPFHKDLDNQLFDLRKSLKTKTEDKDLLNILKRNLLDTVANQLQISKVLLPEDQTSIAVKMFTMMSLGRGCQVADEMSFISSTNSGITLVRPLIDFSDIDLKAYLQTLNEECTEGILSNGSSKRKMKIDSVERQCNDFITNLQTGYPSTVSTLTRIGSKLQSASDQSESNISGLSGDAFKLCRFCRRQCDHDTLLLPEAPLCYGCQHFLNDAHPERKCLFKSLLLFGNNHGGSIISS